MIKFKTIQKVNPRDIQGLRKHYAQVVTTDTVGFDELSETISENSSLMPEDIAGVLIALERNIIRSLKNGRVVNLGAIGTFRLSVSSEGQDTMEDVSGSSIRKAKVNFRAGKGISAMLKNLTYKKSEQVA